MSLKLKLEYYPKINEKLLEKSIKTIQENQNKWDPPFFFDTKSYLDLEEIKQATKPFVKETIKNLITLGTGGSIQTLLALKHLAKKKIFPITSSRAVELIDCLKKTKSDNSVVIPI